MIHDEKPDLDAYILEHYGVKGMKWGVRKQKETSDGEKAAKPEKTPLTKEQKKARAKKVAIGTGILVAAAGAAFVAYKLKKDGKLPLKSLKRAKPAVAKKAVDKVLHEQVDIIHVSRGKNVGYGILRKGGIPNYYQEAEKHLAEISTGTFNKLADGRIVARMADPEGRRDFSGRPIGHDMIIPKSYSSFIHNMGDVEKIIWPQLKPMYDQYYEGTERIL